MKFPTFSPCKYLQIFTVAASILAPHIARADAPPPPLLNPTQAQIERVDYPLLRIGDIAPMFALPDVRGRLWSSTSRLGQSSLLVISLSEPIAPAPSIGDERTTIAPVDNIPAGAQIAVKSQLLGAQLQSAATRLEKLPVTIVVVASGAQFDGLLGALGGPQGLEKRANLLLLREGETLANNAVRWSEVLGVGESGVMLAAIDRAGFLRQWESLSDLQTLDAQLWKWNDVTPRLEVGRAAPDFSIPDTQNRARRLSDLRGKNLLLTFFPKCFTGGCANHLSSLQAERAAFDAANTQIWAASFDTAEGERGQIGFAKQLGLQFPLVPDTRRNLALLYEAAFSSQQNAPARMTVLIDRDGIVRHIDRSVQVRTHGPDTLLKMRELGLID